MRSKKSKRKGIPFVLVSFAICGFQVFFVGGPSALDSYQHQTTNNTKLYNSLSEGGLKMRLFTMSDWKQLTIAEPKLWRYCNEMNEKKFQPRLFSSRARGHSRKNNEKTFFSVQILFSSNFFLSFDWARIWISFSSAGEREKQQQQSKQRRKEKNCRCGVSYSTWGRINADLIQNSRYERSALHFLSRNTFFSATRKVCNMSWLMRILKNNIKLHKISLSRRSLSRHRFWHHESDVLLWKIFRKTLEDFLCAFSKRNEMLNRGCRQNGR